MDYYLRQRYKRRYIAAIHTDRLKSNSSVQTFLFVTGIIAAVPTKVNVFSCACYLENSYRFQ